MAFDEAAARPFETIDSGPAAGAVGAGELCRDLGVALAITADVGGTSFDTCLVIDGRPPIKYEGRVGDLVVQTPWVDVRSIGSGGGSIAYIDEGGLLRVGPESAGADPGPACYAQGGTQPTVTDAAAVLGMLALGQLADGVVLDVQAARKALEPLASSLSMTVHDVAIGVITIANAQMADAIREVTGERGQDPREATLLAFGGAGPLFATLLAQELEIERVIVPPYAGNFSAWGLLGQDLLRSSATTSVASLTAEGLNAANRELRKLFDQLRTRSSSSGLDQQPEAALDMRFRGQDYTLTIPVSLRESDSTIVGEPAAISEAFKAEYERVFGHALDDPVEIVSVRATLRTPLPRGTFKAATSERSVETLAKAPIHSAWSFTRGAFENFLVVDRASFTTETRLEGPAIVLEETTTTYVDAGFELMVHPSGALVISNSEPLRDRPRRAAEISGTDSVQPGAVDPVLTEVIRQGLLSAAEQMKIALRRTAFSPMVYDMIDFCCALYDREVRLLAQAQAAPLFLGTMGFCIEGCVRAVGGEEALEPGDVLFSTYAYDIGSHPQDATIVVPAFLEGSLIGYAAIKAHHMDIGAVEPFCTNTTDNFQEGAIFPGVRIFRGGRRDEDMYRTVLANSRLPTALAGDLNAQIVAANVGLAALRRLIERYGDTSFRAAVERIFDHGEATARHFLAQIPDGRYIAAGALDNDGLSDQLVPFTVAAEVDGSNVVVDFADCPPQQAGPINCPLPTTVAAARLAIVTIAGGGESANEGQFRPIEVRTKPGTLFHPQAPAPIYLYAWPATQAIDAIHRAIAEVMPEVVSAGSGGDYCGIVWWGRRRTTGEFWAGGTDHVTGQGATHDGDGGAPLMHISFSGMRNTAAETLELRHPLVVERFELAQDSGGAGRFRGGPGLDVRYRMLEDGHFTSPIERTRTRPWGLRNGKPARPNALRVLFPDGSAQTLAKTTAFAVPEGSVIEILVGGGGGYGAPSGRDPRAVLEDIKDGIVSSDAARRDYPHAFPGAATTGAVARDRAKV
jgi:N-methylhydantoinase B